MSHTEQFQGTRDGAQVRRPVTHHYRNIGSLRSLFILIIDEPTMRTLQQSDPLNSLNTSPIVGPPRRRSPRSLRPHLNSDREGGAGEPSSRPITIAPVTTRRDWNFNRPAWSRISQSPSTAFHIICLAHSVPAQRPPGELMHNAQVLLRKR